MKKILKWLAVLGLSIVMMLGGWLYHDYYELNQQQHLSRESVLTQIKQMNRLESTAFYIDTIIHTEKKGDWRKLWQDSQSGLFVVKGKVLAGLDLDKLKAENVNIIDDKVIISLPEVEVLSVDLEDRRIYNIHTGSLNLLPIDKNVFKVVQNQARQQVLAAACKSDILQHANRQTQIQLENLFALTQTKVSVYPSAAPVCKS